MYACRHSAFAQVQVFYAVVVEALVAKLECGLSSRHLGEMCDELGDGRVLDENQLLGGLNELVARKLFELREVALEGFDHCPTPVIYYTPLFLWALRLRQSMERRSDRNESRICGFECSGDALR